MSVIVHPADVQDRDGARELLRTARRSFPFIETIFADGGYQGPRMAATVATTGCWKLEIVKRTDAHRFVALPKRWIVERTFAWISRNRRLARDFERYARTVVAFVRLAMIRIMLRAFDSNRGKRPGGQAAARWRMRSGKGRMGGAPGMSSRLPR